jgi:hypothetical protein
MNSMREILITLLFTAVLGLGLGSCAALESFFGEGTVITTADQLEDGEAAPTIPWDQLPEDVKAHIPEGTEVVMATKEQLKEDAAFIPVGGELDGNSVGGIIDAGFGIASTFIPGLAAWEGIVTLFSQRKRKHYGKAIKSIVPMDKNMDFGGALAGVTAAMGLSHSSSASAEAFEAEEQEGGSA